MPISSHAVIPFILEETLKRKPQSVLDIGIGNGMYGALIYNYATTLMPWIPVIKGIEAWPEYRNPMWELYHEVIIKDVNLVEFAPGTFDVIIMADVIEHMDEAVGQALIAKIKTWLSPSGILLVSTPGIFIKQGPYKGNKYEVHKSLWNNGQAEKAGLELVKPADHTVLGEIMLVYKYLKTGG